MTVCGSEGPHNINDHGSTTPEGIVTTVAGTAAITGSNNLYLGGEPLIVLGPEHAATAASSGWSKDDFRRAVWEQARVPLARLSPENIERFSTVYPEGFKDRPPDDAGADRARLAGRHGHRGGRRGQALGVHPDLRRHAVRHARDHGMSRGEHPMNACRVPRWRS